MHLKMHFLSFPLCDCSVQPSLLVTAKKVITSYNSNVNSPLPQAVINLRPTLCHFQTKVNCLGTLGGLLEGYVNLSLYRGPTIPITLSLRLSMILFPLGRKLI